MMTLILLSKRKISIILSCVCVLFSCKRNDNIKVALPNPSKSINNAFRYDVYDNLLKEPVSIRNGNKNVYRIWIYNSYRVPLKLYRIIELENTYEVISKKCDYELCCTPIKVSKLISSDTINVSKKDDKIISIIGDDIWYLQNQRMKKIEYDASKVFLEYYSHSDSLIENGILLEDFKRCYTDNIILLLDSLFIDSNKYKQK